ncbi:TonB-dependent receptor, partial [Pseudomonas sp. FW305-130]
VALFQKSLSDLEYTGTTSQQIAGQTWTVTQPLNLNSSDLIGVEVSGQYTFTSLPAPFDGLGVQANASYVHPSGGSSSVQGYVDTDPVTYNLIGFYEKGPIQFRMAYNWRNAYISQHNAVTLNGRPYENDLFVSAYGELDASLNIA